MIKKFSLAAIVLIGVINLLQAQTYSQWIADSQHPELQVRYFVAKDGKGYTNVWVQVQNTKKSCKLELTASLCNKDKNDINQWQPVSVVKNKPTTRQFKVLNSCTNGFFWWYRKFNDKGQLID